MAKKVAKRQKTENKKSVYHHGDLRRALMEAASELLEEVGYDGFTLRKCAARAGVSPSAPAHHFKDAKGLLNCLAADGFRSMSKKLRSAFLSAHNKVANPCTSVAIEYLTFAKEYPSLYQVMFGSKLNAEDPELKMASEECFENLLLSVSELYPEKCKDEIYAISLYMWSSSHGLAMLISEGRLNFIIDKSSFKNLDELVSAWLRAQAVSVFKFGDSKI